MKKYEERHFSFLQGFFSIFFGTRYGRMKVYYNSYNKISESESIRQDFREIGEDIRGVMKKEGKKSNLQLQECD
jgi:hypothetical protein